MKSRPCQSTCPCLVRRVPLEVPCLVLTLGDVGFVVGHILSDTSAVKEAIRLLIAIRWSADSASISWCRPCASENTLSTFYSTRKGVVS